LAVKGHKMKKSKNIHERIATVCGIGYFPIAPGTAGSFAGLILCLLLHSHIVLYITAFIILFTAGVISSGMVERGSVQKDPGFIVIDEFANIFPVFLFIPLSVNVIIAGFILYRIFDIIKIPPLKKLEKLHGGWGIMLDDLASAIYANLILQILIIGVRSQLSTKVLTQ